MTRERIKLENRIIWLDTVASTNDTAIKMLQGENVPEGTVILADFQSAGKGQKGSLWESEKGKNLTFSIILFPGMLTAENQFYISMCISNGLVDFLSEKSIKGRIKWPNDIYATRGKIGGILIENTLTGKKIRSSVIGIGLNVNQDVFSKEIGTATSMRLETSAEFDRRGTFNDLLGFLSLWINRLYEADFAGIKISYLNKLLFLNEWRAFSAAAGPFEGRIIDVSDNGELLVQNRDLELKKYYFKEITF